ncbi:MAG: hypothetical protein HUU25_05490 [Candidatus Sumerlaeia bacterium]|nr:hypothetical protein [Candidatus Sumerlaeia bacterium]
MPRLAPRLALALTAVPAAASPIAVPYGMHGPTFSHMHSSPDVWERGQTTFDAFHQLGLDWARMDLWWGVAEPERGRYDWGHFDRAVQAYADNQISLMAILCYGPAWNRSEAPVTGEDRQAWGEYVFHTVSRYRDTVHEWEVWNEPNILPFWSPEPSAADYAEVLRIAFEQAKRADPDCTVVGGGMAGPDAGFLRGVFEAGAGECFDVLSYHNYGNRVTRDGVRDELARLRGVLAEFGRADVPIWLSEHGIFTGPGGVTEREQARDIVRVALWRFAEGVERHVYLSLRDWFGESDPQARDMWGLLDVDGRPKRSFAAVRTMAREIRQRPFAGEVALGTGVEAFLFGGVNDNALAIMSTGGSREITLDAGVTHLMTVSLTGEETLLTEAGRTFDLTLTGEPMWLENVGRNLVLLAATRSAPVTVARGEAAPLTVRIENPFDREITVTLTPGEVQGLHPVIGGAAVTLAPGHAAEVRMDVHAAADARIAVLDLPLALQVEGLALPPDEAVHHASIAIAEPFSLARLPGRSLDGEGRLPLAFALDNHLAEPLAYTAGLRIDGESSTAIEGRIPAGASGEIHFGLSLDALAPGAAIAASVEVRAAGHTVTAGERLRGFPIARLAHSVTIDGDLSEWTGPPTLTPDQFHEEDFNPNMNGGDTDISLTGWLAWSPEGMHLALRVTDDVVDLPPDRMIWDWDGLQIAFDTEHDAVEGTGFDDDDMEIEIGRLKDGSTLVFAGAYPPGRIDDVVTGHSEVAVAAGGGEICYEIFFPAAVLDPMRFEAGALIGFNLIQNEADGQGREGWLELAPGIGWGKEPHLYPTGVLMP